MKTKRIVLSVILLSSLLLLNKCFLFRIANLEDLTNKSPEEYNHFLSEMNYDTTYSYQFNPLYYDSLETIKYSMNMYKIEHNSPGFSAIQIRWYDSTGKFISGFEQCFGKINKHTTLLDTFPMRRVKYLPINESLRLENDLKWINIPEEELPSVIKQSRSTDYTIILSYSIWAGWWNEHILEVFRDYLSEQDDDRYTLITVNFDVEREEKPK